MQLEDDTLKSYKLLLLAFQQSNYHFQTFEEFVTSPSEGKVVVLRHDVDELAWNALKMAQLENSLGIRATYFFRIVKQSQYVSWQANGCLVIRHILYDCRNRIETNFLTRKEPAVSGYHLETTIIWAYQNRSNDTLACLLACLIAD